MEKQEIFSIFGLISRRNSLGKLLGIFFSENLIIFDLENKNRERDTKKQTKSDTYKIRIQTRTTTGTG